MTTEINGKIFLVKETAGKFFYWSPRGLRWLPVAKKNVAFS